MAHEPSNPVRIYGQFDENDPVYQCRLLGNRIDQMEKDNRREKDELETEIEDLGKKLKTTEEKMADMERVYQRGLGVVSAIVGLGVAIGFLFSYGKIIFAPWNRS